MLNIGHAIHILCCIEELHYTLHFLGNLRIKTIHNHRFIIVRTFHFTCNHSQRFAIRYLICALHRLHQLLQTKITFLFIENLPVFYDERFQYGITNIKQCNALATKTIAILHICISKSIGNSKNIHINIRGVDSYFIQQIRCALNRFFFRRHH